MLPSIFIRRCLTIRMCVRVYCEAIAPPVSNTYLPWSNDDLTYGDVAAILETARDSAGALKRLVDTLHLSRSSTWYAVLPKGAACWAEFLRRSMPANLGIVRGAEHGWRSATSAPPADAQSTCQSSVVNSARLDSRPAQADNKGSRDRPADATKRHYSALRAD
jgi:hypothetical protein